MIHLSQILSEPKVPGSRGLLQPVQSLVKATVHVRSVLLVASWPLNVHFLLQNAIQKSSFDVQLVRLQVLHCSHSQQGPEGRVLGRKSKDFIKIHAFLLFEALGN